MKLISLLVGIFILHGCLSETKDGIDIIPETLPSLSNISQSSPKVDDKIMINNNILQVKKDKGGMIESPILNEMDVESLEYINYKYLKDKNYIYEYNYSISSYFRLDWTNSVDFDRLGGNYVKGSGKVFFGKTELNSADSISFEFMGRGFARDKNNVYFEGEVIEGADPKTFKIIENTRGNYAKDDENIYYEHMSNIRVINGVDIESFEVLSSGDSPALDYDYAKDNFNAWYKGIIIQKKDNNGNLSSVDSETFEVLYDKQRYSRDADNIYWMRENLPGCTMEILQRSDIADECK